MWQSGTRGLFLNRFFLTPQQASTHRFTSTHLAMDQITLASREYEFSNPSIDALDIDEDPSGLL